MICVAVGCSRPEPPTCDLDSHTIAKWLVDKKLGADTKKRFQWQDDYGQMMFWLDYTQEDWCVDQRPRVDTACWTPAGDDRIECQDARARLERIAVHGPLCAFWLPWFAGEYFGHEQIKFDPHIFREIPMDMICSNEGGLPVGCWTEPDGDQRCLDIFNRIREYFPDDQPEQ
jgi:hypothetical protein